MVMDCPGRGLLFGLLPGLLPGLLLGLLEGFPPAVGPGELPPLVGEGFSKEPMIPPGLVGRLAGGFEGFSIEPIIPPGLVGRLSG